MFLLGCNVDADYLTIWRVEEGGVYYLSHGFTRTHVRCQEVRNNNNNNWASYMVVRSLVVTIRLSIRLLQEFKIATKTNGNLCTLVTGTKDLYSKRNLSVFEISEFARKVSADPDCVAETRDDGQSIAQWELQCSVEIHIPGLLDVAFVSGGVFMGG